MLISTNVADEPCEDTLKQPKVRHLFLQDEAEQPERLRRFRPLSLGWTWLSALAPTALHTSAQTIADNQPNTSAVIQNCGCRGLEIVDSGTSPRDSG